MKFKLQKQFFHSIKWYNFQEYKNKRTNRLSSGEELFIQRSCRQITFVDLESDGMFTLAFLLLLEQRDHDRAVFLLVERVGIAQVDEELRIHGERSLKNNKTFWWWHAQFFVKAYCNRQIPLGHCTESVFPIPNELLLWNTLRAKKWFWSTLVIVKREKLLVGIPSILLSWPIKHLHTNPLKHNFDIKIFSLYPSFPQPPAELPGIQEP